MRGSHPCNCATTPFWARPKAFVRIAAGWSMPRSSSAIGASISASAARSTARSRTSSASDVAYFDRHEFDQPARLPRRFGVEPDRGCPYDCGLCTEHEQHTCIALIEVTTGCNLKCPHVLCRVGSGRQAHRLRHVHRIWSIGSSNLKALPTCCRSPAASRRSIPISFAWSATPTSSRSRP